MCVLCVSMRKFGRVYGTAFWAYATRLLGVLGGGHREEDRVDRRTNEDAVRAGERAMCDMCDIHS